MSKLREVTGALFIAAFLALSPLASAAAGSATGASPPSQAPVVIEADEIYFSDQNGTMFAKGTVVVTQDQTKLTGELIRGNAKQSELWADDKARYTEKQKDGSVDLIGSQINYNYGSKTGTIAAASGVVGNDIVAGQRIEILPDRYVIYDGTTTGCPAQVPDYHMSATRVEIWPGDKMIAYNAKFWIKNVVIYSMPKYVTSLKEGEQGLSFPRVGFNHGDGVYIRQHLGYPLGDKVSAFVDLDYYSQKGFRPLGGIKYQEKGYSLQTIYGYSSDDDENWVRREPEYILSFAPQKLFSLPIKYTVSASYGLWEDSSKSSWQRSYGVYFTGDPIKLGSATKLVLGTGYTNTHESYDDSTYNKRVYDATLTSAWSPDFSTTLGYHYRQNYSTLFDYDKPDMAREGDFGFSYKIDRLNKVKVNWSYDLDENRFYDNDVTWSHNLHCWQTDITYRIKRSQLKVSLSTKKF